MAGTPICFLFHNNWSFVAYVISPPTPPSTFIMSAGGATNLLKAVNNVTNAPEAFSGGTTWIGSDNCNNGRTFNGCIDEVAVFTNAMSESQIQGLFLKALGLTNGVAPSYTQLPADPQVFSGQVLLIPAIAGGIPSPYYQWQSGTVPPGKMPSTATQLEYPGPPTPRSRGPITPVPIPNSDALLIITFGTNISSPVGVTVTLIPVANWNKGLWTVNFAVPTPATVGPARTIRPWSSGDQLLLERPDRRQFRQHPVQSLDDGVTPSTVNLGATNWGNGNFYNAGNNLLLDQYMNFGTNGTSMVFTNVPTGKYNLAAYMNVATYANRGREDRRAVGKDRIEN